MRSSWRGLNIEFPLTHFLDSEVASELYVDEVLAGDGSVLYVDRVPSVSALPEAEAALWPGDDYLDEQCRRFHNEVSVRAGADQPSEAGA